MNRLLRAIGLGAVVGLSLLWGACSSSSALYDDPEAYRAEVARLEEHIADHPSDAGGLRDLGVVHLKAQHPNKAYDVLKKAYARNPHDVKTLFYLGLASEGVGRYQAAQELFARYTRVPQSSEYRRLMEGRYEWLARQDAREQVRLMLVREDEIADRPALPNVLAVLPLEYRGSSDRYAPLGRGLSEMMTADLANVRSLRVVERVRLQALLNELELAKQAVIDQQTAPRMGHLLGAGRLVGGSFDVSTNEDVRLDLILAETTSGVRMPNTKSHSGALADLFRLQKELVFQVVDAFDVELTPQERAAIEHVPTESLQAFLAYCRGLQEEDGGNYRDAARFYRQASEIDPSFEESARRQRRMESVSAAAGTPREVMMAALVQGVNVETRPAPSIDLMSNRLSNMGTFSPRERRDPVQEAVGTESRPGAPIGRSELPPPPPPPPASGGN